jgi:ATP-dependent RNA helicase RhlE
LTFEELNINKQLFDALNDLGIIYPTAIQRASFAKVMSGKDVVGIAQTGTGKTFAYLLPILRLWTFSKSPNPTIAIVVPTRELVVQVVEEVKKLTTYMSVRTVGVYGGTNINAQAQLIYDGLDIIVGTPGRLMDLSLNGALNLRNIKRLVIDEVDEMLNLGFRAQLQNIFDLLPIKRQNIMFSATLTDEVAKLIDEHFEDIEKVAVAPSGTPVEKIKMYNYKVDNFNTKINLLAHLLNIDQSMDKVLVFVESKKLADKVYEIIGPKFPGKVDIIHSNKGQNQRFKAVNGFADGTCKVLIATDIIARGLDINGVSHVINVDTPVVPEDYIHRIGRTGRADAQGTAITFTTHMEEGFLLDIQEMMRKEIEVIPFPEEVVVSTVLIEEEKETFYQKNYFVETKLKHSKGAFHDKLDKNMKSNAGGYAKKRAARIKTLGRTKYRNTR